MYGVVNEGGTGAAARIEGVEFSGKTGSAQRISNDLRKSGVLDEDEDKDNGWFVGFAPRAEPGDRGGGAARRRRTWRAGRPDRARRDQILLRQEDSHQPNVPRAAAAGAAAAPASLSESFSELHHLETALDGSPHFRVSVASVQGERRSLHNRGFQMD